MDTNMIPDQHMKDALDALETNATVSISCADKILNNNKDYFDKHQATAIKAQNEDALRMIAALRILTKDGQG